MKNIQHIPVLIILCISLAACSITIKDPDHSVSLEDAYREVCAFLTKWKPAEILEFDLKVRWGPAGIKSTPMAQRRIREDQSFIEVITEPSSPTLNVNLYECKRIPTNSVLFEGSEIVSLRSLGTADSGYFEKVIRDNSIVSCAEPPFQLTNKEKEILDKNEVLVASVGNDDLRGMIAVVPSMGPTLNAKGGWISVEKLVPLLDVEVVDSRGGIGIIDDTIYMIVNYLFVTEDTSYNENIPDGTEWWWAKYRLVYGVKGKSVIKFDEVTHVDVHRLIYKSKIFRVSIMAGDEELYVFDVDRPDGFHSHRSILERPNPIKSFASALLTIRDHWKTAETNP